MSDPVRWPDLSAYGLQLVLAMLPHGVQKLVLRAAPGIRPQMNEDPVAHIARQACRMGFDTDESGVWHRDPHRTICNKMRAHLVEARVVEIEMETVTVHAETLADVMVTALPPEYAAPSCAVVPAPVASPAVTDEVPSAILCHRTVQADDVVAASALHGISIDQVTAAGLLDVLGDEVLVDLTREALSERPASPAALTDILHRRLADLLRCRRMLSELRMLAAMRSAA